MLFVVQAFSSVLVLPFLAHCSFVFFPGCSGVLGEGVCVCAPVVDAGRRMKEGNAARIVCRFSR
jgi:hypothetical protein